MAITLSVPTKVDRFTVLPFPDSVPNACDVDLRTLSFIVPSGLVQLALLLQWLCLRAPRVRLLAPLDDRADAYLERSDLYAHVPPDVDVVKPSRSTLRGPSNRRHDLIPLRRFGTANDVEELVEEILHFLRGLRLPTAQYEALYLAVAELCGNAASHSRSPCGAFLGGQVYTRGYRYLAVGDVGVGIRRHLTRNPAYAGIRTDAAAIRKAIEPGVSGTPEARGWGFEEVLAAAEQVRRFELHIRSGNGYGLVRSRARRESSFRTVTTVFPGTLVHLVLSP